MWSVVLLTDLTGDPVGEVTNAYERKVSYRLRRMTTCTFSVRPDDPLAGLLLETEVLTKLYEDQTIRFAGEITAAQEQGSGEQRRVQVTCADGAWPLTDRLCGKSTTGFEKKTETDRGAVAKELVDTTNAEADTGLRVGTVVASASDLVGPWYYKPISEAIGEMAAALDGFDWIVEPVEPTIDGVYPSPRPVVGSLEIHAAMGSFQSEAVFEFGTGRHNVSAWDRAVSKEGLLTSAFTLPPGFPDSAQGTVQAWSDEVAIDSYGLHEGVVATDLADNSLSLKLAQEHVRVRKRPRQVISFTAVREDTDNVEVPKFRVDYDLGDTVPFRAVEPLTGEVRVNAVFRVYGVDVALDDQGAEQPTIFLVEE